jgi:hypothetical protein
MKLKAIARCKMGKIAEASKPMATTSISIPTELLDEGKAHAADTYRTFSQYVCFLIDRDLRRHKPAKSSLRKGTNSVPLKPKNGSILL